MPILRCTTLHWSSAWEHGVSPSLRRVAGAAPATSERGAAEEKER